MKNHWPIEHKPDIIYGKIKHILVVLKHASVALKGIQR
jgi:hypothetical protein